MEQTTTPAQPAAAQDHVREQPQQPAPTTTQQPWDLPKPEPYKPGRIFGIAKLVLGGLNIVFAIIVLGIGIDILVDPATYEPYVGVFILTIAAGISALWQSADFLTLGLRKSHRPIHPGAHVGIHLSLWILLGLCIASLAVSLSFLLSDFYIGDECTYTSDYCYYYYNSFEDEATASKFFSMMETLIAFNILMTLVHFTLFVLACIETDRRRKYGKRSKVVYLVQSPAGPDGMVHYTPLIAPPATARLNGGVKAGSAVSAV